MLENKQIIVDGVDVSGCECYSEHREGYCGWFIPCEGDFCQYKLDWALQQLKCSEAQCEGMFVTHTDLEMKYKAKEQECERLKNELLTYGATGICEVCTDKSVLQNDKYTKALREIKEIADLSIAHFDIDYLKQAINEILKECEVLNDK